MRTYLVQLRNAARILMHAGIRRSTSPIEAMHEYLASMPKPFSSYEVLKTSTTSNEHNVVAHLAMGPFEVIVDIEHMTAAGEPQNDDPSDA